MNREAQAGEEVKPTQYACGHCSKPIKTGGYCSMKCAVDDGAEDPPEDTHIDDAARYYP